MNFTKGTLENAIKNLASKGKIYTNESQFQFELARELKKQDSMLNWRCYQFLNLM